MEMNMTPEELRAVVDNHRLWLAGTGGARANLRGASLQYANLRGAYLQGADLRDANLQDANLQYASLRGANLQDAYLQYASLRGANLRGASLQGADLQGADLQGADLQDANLQYASLRGADLQYANLQDASLQDASLPAPTMLLLADWGAVSPGLCRELMRYDAENAPDGTKRFNAWAKDGWCPYTNLKIQHVANFIQNLKHWKPGPAKSAYDLMVMCIRERCKNSDYHKALRTKGEK